MNSKSQCKVHKDYTVTPLTLNLYDDSDFCKFPEMDKKFSINEQKTYHQYQNILGTYSDMNRDQHKCCSTNEKNPIINSLDFIENMKCTNCQKYAEILHSMCSECKKKISVILCKDCYNSQQFNEEDQRIADYIQLHSKTSSEENVKQQSSQKDNYYIQMLQAEKPDVYSQPITKEIVNIPFLKPNSTNWSETNSLEQLTSTVENNTAKIVRKTCVISTKTPLEKQKILFMKEDHDPVKDLKSIYSNSIRYDSKIKSRDMEKYNKLHPWK
ncbi:uncharacterized protein LOC111627562 [Centruroides sculpturatus]|uniref:uncharacterized protein LOC111627562 n=1 Tax=Centruroides sculpturatus TaxID=218467 RepID=UPI000C6E19E4|nr:uncharacterized protein LOC111627562 [Centruroides sculpturatus]